MDSENKNEVEREAEKPEAGQQAQPAPQKEAPKPQEKSPDFSARSQTSSARFSAPKISLPKIQIKAESIQWITNKLKEYKRVLLITKKPDMEEFKTTVKASALGMTIIGVVGFIIAIIAQLLTT